MKRIFISLILILYVITKLYAADFEIIPYSQTLTAEEGSKLKELLEKKLTRLTPPPYCLINNFFIQSNFTANYVNFTFPEKLFSAHPGLHLHSQVKDEQACLATYAVKYHPNFPLLAFTPLLDDVNHKTYLLLTVNSGKKRENGIGFLIYNSLPNYKNDWPENKEQHNSMFNLIKENIDLVQFNKQKRIIRCPQDYPQLHHNHYYTLGFTQALCAAFQETKEHAFFFGLCEEGSLEQAKIIINETIRKNIPSYLTS